MQRLVGLPSKNASHRCILVLLTLDALTNHNATKLFRLEACDLGGGARVGKDEAEGDARANGGRGEEGGQRAGEEVGELAEGGVGPGVDLDVWGKFAVGTELGWAKYLSVNNNRSEWSLSSLRGRDW